MKLRRASTDYVPISYKSFGAIDGLSTHILHILSSSDMRPEALKPACRQSFTRWSKRMHDYTQGSSTGAQPDYA